MRLPMNRTFSRAGSYPLHSSDCPGRRPGVAEPASRRSCRRPLPNVRSMMAWKPGTHGACAVNKYADRLPLYRQSQIFARQGVTQDRSTLCTWVGRACWWLAPLHELMLSTVQTSPKVFAGAAHGLDPWDDCRL
jgi:Transposase IS66 family